LFSNALKFSHINGQITVKISVSPLTDTQDHIEIKVTDKGIGIGEEDLQNLFKPFYKTKNKISRSSNPSGNSLGLSISKNIAQCLGGDLTVTSVLGVGSTFCFSFVGRHFKPTTQLDSDQPSFKYRTRIYQSRKIDKNAMNNPNNLKLIDEQDEFLFEDSDLESGDDNTLYHANESVVKGDQGVECSIEEEFESMI
jgi:hypothetical protein